MRTAASSLLILLAGPALAQSVADCDAIPSVTDLVEPWEETSLALGAGAVRLALLRGAGEEGVRLLVLTRPPAEAEEAGAEETGGEGPAPPPEWRCRIVTEGGLGFAALDMVGAGVVEGPEAVTLTARLPALRFVPESTELEELMLVLTFGVGDDSLQAGVELPETPEAGDEEAAPEDGDEMGP